MKKFACILLGLLFFALAPSVAAAPVSSDYLIVEIPFSSAGGSALITSDVKLVFCIDNDSQNCSTHPLESLTFAPATPASVGTTIWAANDAGFQGVTAQLTDGSVDLVGYVAILDPSGPGWFVQSEPDLFDRSTGVGGVDLSGYWIDRIGFRVDSLTLNSPGENPNGDGIWTDYSISGAYVIEGTVASSEACKNGGWQDLHGPDGAFANQGECIQLVKTGV
jgi:hypothetical protein